MALPSLGLILCTQVPRRLVFVLAFGVLTGWLLAF
jgi:hypothetical protein